MQLPTWATATVVLATLLELASGQASMRVPQTRQCSTRTQLCYSEYVTSQRVAYRIAIPSTAVANQEFDVALQIIAPRTTGWAAIAWGGSMVNNPLTVGWPNGQNVTVSPRWTPSYRTPVPYNNETFTILPDQGVNATHWTLSILCHGCSNWMSQNYPAGINPNNIVWIATAINNGPAGPGAVATPASPTSSFSVHDWVARFGFDMTAAKQANFEAVAASFRATPRVGLDGMPVRHRALR